MKTPLIAICVVFLALCACGPGAKISGGKQGAAEALYAASAVTKGGTPAGSGIDIGASVAVSCPQGGSATLHGFSVSTTFGSGSGNFGQSFTADYKNCGVKTELGTAVLTGALAVNQTVALLDGSTSIDQSLKGNLVWGGACDDFLDIDVSQQIGVSALSQTGGGVSMTLKGSVADSEGRYSFNEAVSVTPGKISVEVKAKN